ncbi:hypothetical protein Aoki45_27690 [Algoriphagus sp. oki45]|uniref:hypothetical protein n=1 Tax=Algoriphagus sp. oki45 TaxID=3067294 RepID=UPI00280014B4|nr:hypothetical protein Aoki45_27690 [Algoriphagus sp. oki45]
MKKYFVALLLSVGFFQANAQQEASIFKQGVQGCYTDYYIEFHNRGASEPTDGEHIVVISVIHNNQSECYMGKATIKDGKLTNPVFVQKDDGSYSPLNRMFKALDPEWFEEQDMETINLISDGMSSIYLTQEQYRVRLFFPDLINKNSVVNKRAPSAKELLKEKN